MGGRVVDAIDERTGGPASNSGDQHRECSVAF
jgi:hypothetical protein